MRAICGRFHGFKMYKNWKVGYMYRATIYGRARYTFTM